mgnify:FL=1
MGSAVDLTPLDVPALLREHGLKPNQALGQNFLLDAGALAKLTEAAAIPPGGTVLEIGPGLGSLTRHLAAAAGLVVAVEIDRGLVGVLLQVLAGIENVRILTGDILELDPAAILPAGPYQVVANIPYHITSAIFRHLLESRHKPARMLLTIQREVAERICARPGDLSLLALSVQVYGQPQIVLRIPAGSFYPRPKVDSSVLRVDLYPEPRIPAAQLNAFFRLAKAGYSQKRKTLRNALAGRLGWPPRQAEVLLQTAEIDPQRRAETLSLPEWGRLTAIYLNQ